MPPDLPALRRPCGGCLHSARAQRHACHLSPLRKQPFQGAVGFSPHPSFRESGQGEEQLEGRPRTRDAPCLASVTLSPGRLPEGTYVGSLLLLLVAGAGCPTPDLTAKLLDELWVLLLHLLSELLAPEGTGGDRRCRAQRGWGPWRSHMPPGVPLQGTADVSPPTSVSRRTPARLSPH